MMYKIQNGKKWPFIILKQSDYALNTMRSMSPFLFILRFEKKSANSRAVSCHGTTDICLHDSV